MQTLVDEFKVHHFSIIDLLDEEEDLAQEQEIFEFQEEEVNELTFRLEKLISYVPRWILVNTRYRFQTSQSSGEESLVTLQ